MEAFSLFFPSKRDFEENKRQTKSSLKLNKKEHGMELGEYARCIETNTIIKKTIINNTRQTTTTQKRRMPMEQESLSCSKGVLLGEYARCIESNTILTTPKKQNKHKTNNNTKIMKVSLTSRSGRSKSARVKIKT